MSHDLLRLQERVSLAIQLGESHFREFKSALEGPGTGKNARPLGAISSDIAETLVAFANADGGELLVGIEDDGSPTGLSCSKAHLERLLEAPRTNVHSDTPLPPGRAAAIQVENKTVLYFSVPKGSEFVYLTSDGRCLQRKDRHSVPISVEALTFSRTETVSREYDRQFVDGASLDDLNLALVDEVAARLSKGMSAEKCLQHLDLAEFDGEQLRLRRAALLLFAKAPTRWHPRCQVRLLKIQGTALGSGTDYNVTVDKDATGNILTLIEASWDLVRPHLTETRFSADALFKTQIIYPESACREALINAIAHRDYSIEGRGIEVNAFTDRLQVVSPGGLLSSISVSDLAARKGVHQSRNALVARVLREIGYMRELGEGMRRIYEQMNLSDLKPPELVSSRTDFSITLRHEYSYSTEERLWLDNFAHLNLSREQKTVARLGYGGHVISAQEIWDAVGIVDTDAYRQLIESLRALGILDVAVTRDQAYREADKRGIPKKRVPRFRVSVPGTPPHRSPSSPKPAKTPKAPLKARALEASDFASVFVANLPSDTNQTDLLGRFGLFGTVTNIVLPINPETGKQRGYAFVEYDKREQAETAVRASKTVVLEGHRLVVEMARRK